MNLYDFFCYGQKMLEQVYTTWKIASGGKIAEQVGINS